MPRKSFLQTIGENIVDEAIQQTMRFIYKPKPTKFCKNCGTGITPGSGRRTFCSDLCSNFSRQSLTSSADKFCTNCRKRITPGSGRRTFCSDLCSKENTRNRRLSTKHQTKNVKKNK